MNKIISLILTLSCTAQIFAMERDLAAPKNAEQVAAAPIAQKMPFDIDSTKAGDLISEHNEKHSNKTMFDAWVKQVYGSFTYAGAFPRTKGTQQCDSFQPHDDIHWGCSARATLNVLNSLKNRIGPSLRTHAISDEQRIYALPNLFNMQLDTELNMYDVQRLMGCWRDSQIVLEPAECIELMLRFVCTYYPGRANEILNSIGFRAFFFV